MLDGAIVIPIQSMIWNFLFQIGALMWIVGRALLNVGYFIMALTGWISTNAFAPLLGVVGEQTEVLVGPIFALALMVLGLTYILATFGRFEVVDLRSAITWLIFASFLYTLGPNIYTGMESFRRLVGGGFYEAGIEAFNNASAAPGLNAIGTTPTDVIAVPTDQFGPFLLGVPGAEAVDGLDVAMAYVNADGYDALAAPGPHPIVSVPFRMAARDEEGFFDPATGPEAFGSMADQQRQASIGRAVQGVWRLLTMWLIGAFGIIEQLIHFLMTCAFAIAFFSLFIAVLFGFFRRTEPIASAAFNLIIELFIQSVINSFLMSLILGFVMVGANTANAILLLGTCIVGLWLSFNLLKGCLKGLVSSTDRIFKSFATVTGGHMATATETNQAALSAAVSAATGASVLAGGGSFLQATGATFGDQRLAQSMNYAARMLGGEETLLGSAAQDLGEGASARSIGGPLGGYLLGRQHADERRADRERDRQGRWMGATDQTREMAVQGYQDNGNDRELEDVFTPSEAARVQALNTYFGEDDFETVRSAARRVRNLNPGVDPQSERFIAHLRDSLPLTLQDAEESALQDVARLFGRPANEPSDYQLALAQHPTPQVLGPADLARDDAVAGKIPLEDAFLPDDALRVAQLMDAYDDDDFAALTYAVRAARDQHPDAEPSSLKRLQAARMALPLPLQNTPSKDLAAFSKAFGGSPMPSAVVEGEAAPYIGSADRDRDAHVEAYLAGDKNPQVLRQVFSAPDALAVGSLLSQYGKTDFDAAVKAVRQARTEDPDRDPTSQSGLRSARQHLPSHLRQMPSEDLETLARTFGSPADLPGMHSPDAQHEPSQTPLIGLKQMSGASRHRLIQAGMGSMETLASTSVTKIAGAAGVIEERAAEWKRAAQAAVMPQSEATSAETSHGRVIESQSGIADSEQHRPTGTSLSGGTPITGHWMGMKASHKQALATAGIDSVEALASTPMTQIMAVAQVDERRARDWQMTASLIQRDQNTPYTQVGPQPVTSAEVSAMPLSEPAFNHTPMSSAPAQKPILPGMPVPAQPTVPPVVSSTPTPSTVSTTYTPSTSVVPPQPVSHASPSVSPLTQHPIEVGRSTSVPPAVPPMTSSVQTTTTRLRSNASAVSPMTTPHSVPPAASVPTTTPASSIPSSYTPHIPGVSTELQSTTEAPAVPSISQPPIQAQSAPTRSVARLQGQTPAAPISVSTSSVADRAVSPQASKHSQPAAASSVSQPQRQPPTTPIPASYTPAQSAAPSPRSVPVKSNGDPGAENPPLSRSSVDSLSEPPDVPPLEEDDGPPSPEDVLP